MFVYLFLLIRVTRLLLLKDSFGSLYREKRGKLPEPSLSLNFLLLSFFSLFFFLLTPVEVGPLERSDPSISEAGY